MVFNMGFNEHVMVSFVFKGKTVMNTMLELSPSLAKLNSQDDSRDRIDLHTKGRVC